MAQWGKADFKQLKELQEKIQALGKGDFQSFCDSTAKELAARLLAKVIRRTPVGETHSYMEVTPQGKKQKVTDHMGGTLRRGWTAKTEAEAESGGQNKDGVAYAKSLPVARSGNEFIIEITNPVHYASYVEYGHRQQPGRFIPGEWQGDRFVYDPDAEGGMVLKNTWVKGRYMLTVSAQELEVQAPAILEKKLYQFLKGCFDA